LTINNPELPGFPKEPGPKEQHRLPLPPIPIFLERVMHFSSLFSSNVSLHFDGGAIIAAAAGGISRPGGRYPRSINKKPARSWRDRSQRWMRNDL